MRFCLWPGCTVRTNKAYCLDHERRQERADRGSARQRGYTWKWETEAIAFLAEFPLCGMRPGGRAPVMSRCADEDRVTAAVLVDHVVPHRGDQMLFWDREQNWQSMCRACHNVKTRSGQ